MSEESAEGHATTLEDFCGTKPNVYQCKRCGSWHVGYDKLSKLSKRARRRRTFMGRKRRKRRKQDVFDQNGG
jgi:hypothetical protein